MRLGIYGAGGLGREVLDLCKRVNEHESRWSDLCFIDDFDQSSCLLGFEKYSLSQFCDHEGEKEVVIAVGEPADRIRLYDKVRDVGLRLATVIDPAAIVSPDAIIQTGAIVFEYSIIKSGVLLGSNALVQPFVDLGHDITVGESAVLSPYCSPGGGSKFGKGAFLGMKSAIIEKATVGDGAVVGMGAVVFRDVEPGAVVIGNPARPTKKTENGKIFK